MQDIKNIIESLLIVSETPLTIDHIKKVILSADTKEIRNALETLSEEYEARKGGFFLSEVANGYQIRTRPEYKEWIRRFMEPKPMRLSKASLETLAIIAYKQPVIRSDIEHIRGVDCGGVIRMLLERKLIRILGRKEIPGRPLIYVTTKKFLEVFDLKDLRDLPTPKEIEELASPLPENSQTPLKEFENIPGSKDVKETGEPDNTSLEDHQPEVQTFEKDQTDVKALADRMADDAANDGLPEEIPVPTQAPERDQTADVKALPDQLADGGLSEKEETELAENDLKALPEQQEADNGLPEEIPAVPEKDQTADVDALSDQATEGLPEGISATPEKDQTSDMEDTPDQMADETDNDLKERFSGQGEMAEKDRTDSGDHPDQQVREDAKNDDDQPSLDDPEKI